MTGKEVTIQNQNTGVEIMEKVLMQGDLSKLNPEERLKYYSKVCESIGVNPFTRPFDYIQLNGKLTLYAKKECSDQLRQINGISITSLKREKADDLYIVQASGVDKNGRSDESIAAIYIGNLKGDALANAIMKCETKAKRRLTLSLAGLGWLDETELETIPSDKIVYGDYNIDGTANTAPTSKDENDTPSTPTGQGQTPNPKNSKGTKGKTKAEEHKNKVEQPTNNGQAKQEEQSKETAPLDNEKKNADSAEEGKEEGKEVRIAPEQIIDAAQAEAEQNNKAASTEVPEGEYKTLEIMFLQRKEKTDGTPYLKVAAKGESDIIYIIDKEAVEAIYALRDQLPKVTITVTGYLTSKNGNLLLVKPKIKKAA